MIIHNNLKEMRNIGVFNNNHYSFFYSTPNPFALSSSLILSSPMVIPCICSSMVKEIETSSIFLGDGVVVYMVLTRAFKAKPSPSYKFKLSLYYCLRNEFAAT